MVDAVNAVAVATMSSGDSLSFAGLAMEPFAVLLPELLPAGGLGRPPSQEGMPQHLLQKPLMHRAFGGHRAAAVVLALALRDDAHHAVDDHVARPGVERQDAPDAHRARNRMKGNSVACVIADGQKRHIGDAADVLHGPAQLVDRENST